jgi:hypothetical protein
LEQFDYDAQKGGWFLINPNADGVEPGGEQGSVTKVKSKEGVNGILDGVKSLASGIISEVADAGFLTEGQTNLIQTGVDVAMEIEVPDFNANSESDDKIVQVSSSKKADSAEKDAETKKIELRNNFKAFQAESKSSVAENPIHSMASPTSDNIRMKQLEQEVNRGNNFCYDFHSLYCR